MKTHKFLIAVLLLSGLALAQASRFDNFSWTTGTITGTTGVVKVAPSAVVTVCTYPAATFGACVKAPLCPDSTGVGCTTASNPVTADSSGNFGWWIAPGKYDYWITAFGNNVGPYSIVAADPVAAVHTTGNESIAGNKTFSGTTALNGPTTFGGAATFNSSSTHTGTESFTNTITFNGANVHTGAECFDRSNSTWYMGCSAYPCTQVGLTSILTAANAVGGKIDANACTSLAVTTANNIGDGTHSVALILPNTGTWTLTGITNGTSCFFTLKNGSSIIDNGTANGGSKLTIRGDDSANNADSIICTDASTYTRIQGGFILYNPSPGTPGTFVNGLLHWALAFDGSSVRDITIANYAGIGAFIDSPCCGAAWDKVVINGNNQTNAIPLIIDTTTNNHSASFACNSCSIVHAGDGKHEIEIKQTGSGNTGPINFYNLYIEGDSVAQTVSHIEITKAWGGVNLFGGDVAVVNATEAVASIHVAAGAQTILNVFGMNFWAGLATAPRILDDIRSVTVNTPGTAAGHFVPFYSTYNPSVRSERGTTTLSTGAGTGTFGLQFMVAPICVATDQTAANAVKATSSATTITLAGTGSDVIAWRCDGNPN